MVNGDVCVCIFCLASVGVHLWAHLIYDVLTVEVPGGVWGAQWLVLRVPCHTHIHTILQSGADQNLSQATDRFHCRLRGVSLQQIHKPWTLCPLLMAWMTLLCDLTRHDVTSFQQQVICLFMLKARMQCDEIQSQIRELIGWLTWFNLPLHRYSLQI